MLHERLKWRRLDGMRGDHPPLDLTAAVAVLDLHAAGVWAEMADEPYPWDVTFAPAPPSTAPALSALPSADTPPPLMPRAPSTPLTPAPLEPSVSSAPAADTLVSGGKGGGVVVILPQVTPLEGPEHTLLMAMLRAVALEQSPLAWIGIGGKPGSDAIHAALAAFSPQRVLVLGQDALVALTGSKAGVEGWHAGAKGKPMDTPLQALLDTVAVGVTYPPALLLRQPLFKRLAWRHLLAWKAACSPLSST